MLSRKRPKSVQSPKRPNFRRIKNRAKGKARAEKRTTKVANRIHRRLLGRDVETKGRARRGTQKLVGKKQEILLKRSSGRKEKFDTTRLAQTMGRHTVFNG
jgi:hypothetical protein